MPIEIDIRKNEVIGREIRKAEQEAALRILRLVIEKRFGPMPGWAVERLAMRTAPELEGLGDRVLDAPTLEDLLP